MNPPHHYEVGEDCANFTTPLGTDLCHRLMPPIYASERNTAFKTTMRMLICGAPIITSHFNVRSESITRFVFIKPEFSFGLTNLLLEVNEGRDWEQLRLCHLAIPGESTLDMAAGSVVPAGLLPIRVTLSASG
jgi:hypothetical protein